MEGSTGCAPRGEIRNASAKNPPMARRESHEERTCIFKDPREEKKGKDKPDWWIGKQGRKLCDGEEEAQGIDRDGSGGLINVTKRNVTLPP
jgi:hypothetical protein